MGKQMEKANDEAELAQMVSDEYAKTVDQMRDTHKEL